MVEPVTTSVVEPARENAFADLELSLLLEAMLRFSGHDFTDYAQATLKRRVADRMRAENVATISGLQERVLHDPEALARFVSRHVERIRRPLLRSGSSFRAFRARVVPLLRTYAFTRIWVPNCACGEDAYSLAVLLREEGLLDRTMIYGTDASELAVERGAERSLARSMRTRIRESRTTRRARRRRSPSRVEIYRRCFDFRRRNQAPHYLRPA